MGNSSIGPVILCFLNVRVFYPLQNSMLTVLTSAVTTLSAKKSSDSLKAIESVGNGLVANLGQYVCMFRQ